MQQCRKQQCTDPSTVKRKCEHVPAYYWAFQFHNVVDLLVVVDRKRKGYNKKR